MIPFFLLHLDCSLTTKTPVIITFRTRYFRLRIVRGLFDPLQSPIRFKVIKNVRVAECRAFE